MEPMFPYYGSKFRLARRYPAPRCDEVVEAFAGGAGYATYHAVKRAHLVDADPIIAGLWRYLIAATPGEILALPEMPEAGDTVDNYNLPQEAKWLIGFWLNRGSATPKKTRTTYSTRTDRGQLNWGARAKQRVARQLEMVRGWTVREGSYAGEPNREATWFIDPPYGDKGRYYRVGFSDFQHLGAWCRERHGQVIACEGPDADWLPFRPLGSFKSTKGRADETVWLSDGDSDLFGFAA